MSRPIDGNSNKGANKKTNRSGNWNKQPRKNNQRKQKPQKKIYRPSNRGAEASRDRTPSKASKIIQISGNQRWASVKSPEINISTRVNNQRWRQNQGKQKTNDIRKIEKINRNLNGVQIGFLAEMENAAKNKRDTNCEQELLPQRNTIKQIYSI